MTQEPRRIGREPDGGVAAEVYAALEVVLTDGREMAVAAALARMGLVRVPRSRTMLRPFAEALVHAVRAQHGGFEADQLRLELARRLGGLLHERTTRAETPRARSGVREKVRRDSPARRVTLPVAEPLATFQRPTLPAPPRTGDAPDEDGDPRAGAG